MQKTILGRLSAIVFSGFIFVCPGLAQSPLTITTTSVSQGEIGVTYNQPIMATGGSGTYSWSISGTAPLVINSSTGVVSSNGPLNGGNDTTFTVTVRDSAEDTATSPVYTLLVDSAVSITTFGLPNAAVGESYGVMLTASGGSASYSWSAAGLPSWLTLTPTGVLSGTAPIGTSTVSPASFSVTVTDTAGGTKTVPLSLGVTLPIAYLVQNESGGLVQVAGDGSSVSTQSTVVGDDVAIDADGNSVVAAVGSLQRVTPGGGSTSPIANAPSGSAWLAVAADGLGNFIVGDNEKHAVWRVAADGSSTTLVANYPVQNIDELEDIKVVVDVHGNYIVAEDNGGSVGIFSITTAGTVNRVTLTGATPAGVGGLAFDANNNYVLLDYISDVLYQISPQGAVTQLASGVSRLGLARNPLTNQYVTGVNNALQIVTGGSVSTLVDSQQLPTPEGIATLTQDFPSTVDATNPLGYFRLETATGSSEVNNTYTYTLNEGATISSAGAPIGNAANNSVVLDGSTGYVSTSLSGHVNTAGSLMAWVNLSELPSASGEGANYIAGESTVGNDLDLQFDSANVLRFYTTANGQNISYTPNPASLAGQWHMIVATFDATASTRAIYWDGQLVASDNVTSYTNKPGTFQIGSSAVFSGRFFPGSIDEAAVWNYALTAPQVYRMFAARPTGSGGTVNALSPAATPPNSAATTVTISGQNFSFDCDGNPCSAVWFTSPTGQTTILNQANQVTSVSSNQIVVTIPAALLTTAGIAQISVANLQGVPSNRLPFSIQAALMISPSMLPAGQTHVPYSQSLTASGGSGNYSWSIVSEADGLNLSLNPSTGTTVSLTGTPTSADTDDGLNITVMVTDNNTQNTAQQTYTIPVSAGPSTPPAGVQPSGTTAYVLNSDGSLVAVTPGAPSAPSSATSFEPGYECQSCYDMARDAAGDLIVAAGNQLTRYTSSGSALPAIPAVALPNSDEGTPDYSSVAVDTTRGGNYIVIDSARGAVVSVSPTAPYTATLIATLPPFQDAYVRVSASGNYVVALDNAFTDEEEIPTLSIFVITPGTLPVACPSDGPGCVQIPITPSGSTATPATTGGFTFDASGNYVDVDYFNDIIFTITPTGTSTPLFSDPNQYMEDPEGIYRDPSSGAFFLVDDETSTLYTLTPDGLNLKMLYAGGLLTSPESLVVVYTAPYVPPPVTKTPLSISSNGNLGEIALGSPIYDAVTATGGTTPYKFSATGLPAGLTLNSASGSLSGTPQQPGLYSFTVTVSDSESPVATASETATLGVLGITTSSTLPPAITTEPYSQTFTAAGGTGTYSFSSSSAPAGLSFTGSTLSGTPTAAGSFTFPVQVTDASGKTVTGSFTLVVTAGLSISTSGNLGEIAFGSGVGTTFAATGGKAPYVWSATGLPSGLTLNASSGALSGSVASPGNYSFTVQVSDAETPAATRPLMATLRVLGLTTPATLPAGSTTAAYAETFSAAGGTGAYTFSSPNAPAGLSFSGATLAGTPAKVGTYSFTVNVADGSGITASSTYSLVVTGPATPLTLSGTALTSGMVGAAYNQALTGTGGAPPYTWTIIGGALPTGLPLNGATGVISGTASAAGIFTFTAQATDSQNNAATAVFTITIAPQPLILTGLPFPDGIVGSQYPLQVLSANGGVGPYTYKVSSGTLPPGLTLTNGTLQGTPTASGTFSFTITTTDAEASAQTISSPTQLYVSPAGSANLLLSSASLSFNLTIGATGLPVAQSVTVESSVVQQMLNYTVTPTPAVSWLDVSGGGTTPGSISIALDPSALNLGVTATPLTTSVVVTCVSPSPCAGLSQTIAVSLLVSAPAPLLTFTSSVVAFNTTSAGTSALSQQVGIQNIGGGSAVITSATAADSWLTVSGVPGSVPAGAPVNITLTANPALLPGPGYYRTIVTIQSSAGAIMIPVTLDIAQAPTLMLSNAGATFQSTIGQAPPVTSGSFQVTETGGTAVGFSAAVLPGAPWLVLKSFSTTTGVVSYAIDPAAAAGLTPAQAYYGTIQITASGATNSPQNYLVVLNVAPPASLAAPDPEPAGLLFQSTFGAAAPAGQTVTVNSTSASATVYAASTSASWISVSPSTGTSSNTSPAATTVTVTPGTMAAGVYTGTVSYQFSAAAVRSVNVTLIVLPAGATAGTTAEISTRLTKSGESPSASAGCSPAQLVPTQTGLVNNFAQPTSWPTPLSISVVNNCGASVGNGQVVATFSNGDPPLALGLVNSGTGLYSGTWTPRGTSQQVTVTATATAPGFTAVAAKITGQVVPNAAPVLAANGTLHIYDPQLGGALGQGTILQIYGSNLGASPAVPSTVPLPTTLNGTSVIIGGIPAPLYYVSAGQIDAQLPLELTPGNNYQVVVNANGALSTANSIQVAAATPGIAAFPSGQIVAQHGDYSLVSAASPAAPGEYLVIYLSGLGTTNDTVADGASSPSSPLGQPLVAPTLTLNGTSIPIYFSGLTPGYVGLYQMNFQVPATTPNGDAQLVVTQGGMQSNSTILPVHN